ncbi:putative inorganic phosphate cotransporter isoform X2 [Leptinotarsa decemlineata]|uniref:putative inorganic phosphate cotransporter isoform X2 n=1 Tax=Leptinotarsa decemlineata TaxID=7539 RepID=UPI003D30D173
MTVIHVSKSSEVGPSLGIRHVQAMLMFLLLSIGVGMRVHLSVAIVAMTDNTTSSNPDVPTYDWTNKSVILSSFYWGYILLQLWASELGRNYGTKKFLIGSMFINSTASMLVPVLAEQLGSYGVMGCRAVQGLSQGFFYPSMYNILGRWSPKEERSTLGSLALSGNVFGTILTMPVVGFLSSSWLGWPSTFYLFGCLGYAWILLWFTFGANSPSEHGSITDLEKDYISKSLGNENKEKTPAPWKAILTSLPVWAIVITHIGQTWGYTTLITQIPNYMNKVMKFDIKSNGLLSAAPYLGFFFITGICGVLADYVINKAIFSISTTRKIFTASASVIPAAALMILSFLPDDARALSVTMLIVAIASNAGINAGFNVNHIDLSPKYAGILVALGNSSGNVFAILAPLLVQVILTDETDKSLWRIIFVTSAVWYLASSAFYVMFAAGTVQWWNDVDEKPKKDDKTDSVRDIPIRKMSTIINT